MRKIIIALSCCTVLLLIGYASYRGLRLYREKNWMRLAKDYAAISDGRNEVLCLQQALRVNPKNIEACRMMAEVTEVSRSPSALMWRHRIVELNPKSTDDRLALAKTALMLRDYATATNAFDGLSEAGKKTFAYHNLAGTIAVAVGQPDIAASHYTEAARIEPWNSVPQLNLAIVRLAGTNTLDLAEARIGLRRVSLNSTNLDLRCLALRGLVADARRFKQNDAALDLSAELLAQTNSIFQDKLLRLDLLRETKASSFKSTLVDYQREAAGTDGKRFELATWQMANTGPRETLAWLQSLPVQNRTNQSVCVVMAECQSQLGNWTGLQSNLTNQNWAEMEFMRHAFLSRALRGQELIAAAKAEWGQARQGAGVQKGRLAMLLQFAVRSKWNSETEEILWAIVNQFPEDQLSVRALTQVLYEQGRTRPLMSLYTLQAKRNPADLSVKNNLAMTALLLGAQELKPHDLAREIYQKAPTNGTYCSTYAFSLHLQKKDVDALKVMQQLKPEALADTGIAGYYGLILKATGDQAKALTYLGWAFKSPVLLPEEKKLFEQARSGK